MMTKYKKEFIKERDGFKCRQCGAINHLTVDHIVPVSRGGTDELSNLQCLCIECNKIKANKIYMSLWQRIKYALNVHDEIRVIKNEYKGGVSGVQRGINELTPQFDKKISKLEARATQQTRSLVESLRVELSALRLEIEELKTKKRVVKKKKIIRKKKKK